MYNNCSHLHETPETEVSLILCCGHTTITNLKHVWVIPTTRTRIVPVLFRLIDISIHAKKEIIIQYKKYLVVLWKQHYKLCSHIFQL